MDFNAGRNPELLHLQGNWLARLTPEACHLHGPSPVWQLGLAETAAASWTVARGSP